ncbi:MAG: Methyltransferase type 11 [Solirubrobacterales bacterium]|nr:Methyltransferase type 11 [Solirubrobacterales bacterium]
MPTLATPAATRFHAERPRDLRRATPWHRLSYIVAALPRGLEQLAHDVPRTGRILDYGCADMPYRRFFADDADYVGADLPGNPEASVEIAPDGTVPLPDESVDVVLSTQVLEHVADPAVYLAECARVLRPGGRMLLSTHGLMVYHPDPVDYWRWTCAGLRRSVGQAGLHVVRFEGIMGLTATGLQLVQDAWYWRLGKLRHAFALVMQTLIKIAERLEPPSTRELNALVFALVAEKPRPLALPEIVAAFAQAHPQAVFVEVGSNDGEQHDHLRPHILGQQWRGVMVEPVPYVFARLTENYAGVDGVALENAAIAAQDGRLPFFHLRDADAGERAALPDWYDGVGSFNREAILTHAPQMPDIAERIVELEVPALTFGSLLAKHDIERPDLLVIDTEGHDWAIIRSIDLANHGPRLLIYEHFHLSRADRAACLAHLEAAGYETLEEGFDTIALRPAEDALTELFRGATPAVGGVAKYEEAG